MDKPSETSQTVTGRDENGRFTYGNKPVAGFDKHPENISPGGWKKEDNITSQYNRFMRMTAQEIKDWEYECTEDKRTMAQELAYRAIIRARKTLKDLQEITDRTEGKPQQSNDLTTKGESLSTLLVKFIGNEPKPTDGNTD